jgi:hypothetical protein
VQPRSPWPLHRLRLSDVLTEIRDLLKALRARWPGEKL